MSNAFKQIPDKDDLPPVLEAKPIWIMAAACGIGLQVSAIPLSIGGILYLYGLTQTVG